MSQTHATPEGQTKPPSYKKTLNPRATSFPMRANLLQNEPKSLARWIDSGLYDRVVSGREGRPRFNFHDGPPYTTGSIHIGHLVNRTLKDFVVRTKLMEGLCCPFIPGWDCHGLPIEHKVMSELLKAGKLEKLSRLSLDERRMAIRKACASYAEKYHLLQDKQMKRLLTLADYDHPYLTMRPAYEQATLEVFADMVAQGIVYRQLKSVHWSIENETALADAELEYYDREDISVYVDFEAEDRSEVMKAFGLDPQSSPAQTPSFMIWTTTPWTLPANLAIAVHPRFEYALVLLDGSVTVLAKDLVERVTAASGSENGEVLATTTGARLAGLAYKHPLYDSGGPDLSGLPHAATRHADPEGIYRVVEADYVTLDDGTGLVHTAPGHGSDDYATGLRERLPIYCPVREDGTYDQSVPSWLRGVSIWDANRQVTEHLRTSGHLFHDHTFTHSYPHDWRGKSPVIFRATEQWFVSVDEAAKETGSSLRTMALDQTASEITFIPEWGRNRMRGMLESRPDWCISRQRAWGLPIPAFFGPSGDVLLTPASVRAVAKRFGEAGSDAWFNESPAELLRHYDVANDSDAPKGVDTAALVKGHDIFDVWFESGSSWNEVMRKRSEGATFPADLYLEGSDQHRGWFQLSLLCGLGSQGCSPFRNVLTHGFMVDRVGHKMSKSLGNTLDVDELIKDFGADVCRWWVGTLSYEQDMKSDQELFEIAADGYRKIRNTLRFFLMNLADFDGESALTPLDQHSPTHLDTWALTTFDRLGMEVRSAYAAYDYRRATGLLYDFCNETMSQLYLAAVKDRLYCDKPDSVRRRRTQSTLWRICDAICRLLAPLIPHTSDEAWRALHGVESSDAKASVHLAEFAEAFGIEADSSWEYVLRARDQGLRALEEVRSTGAIDNPLDSGIVLPDPNGGLERFEAVDLADLMGVSRVRVDPGATSASVQDLSGEPRCDRSWKRDGTVRRRADGGMLSDRDAEAVGTD